MKNKVINSLTLMIQINVTARTFAEYERKRDTLIRNLENKGWNCNVEDEGEGEFEDENEEGFEAEA